MFNLPNPRPIDIMPKLPCLRPKKIYAKRSYIGEIVLVSNL